MQKAKHVGNRTSQTSGRSLTEQLGFVVFKDSLAIVFLQFMYILGICLLIELTGGVVALIFRNQVSRLRLGLDHQERYSQSVTLQLCY